MSIYLKQFETQAAYEAAESGLILPNVSYCKDNDGVHYSPIVPETRIVAKYNVTSTSSPTALRTSFEPNIFKSMEIDGVMLDELVTEYTFGTVGIHTVKYELYDETKLGNSAPVFYNSNLIECIVPNSVININYNVFNGCIGLISVTIGSGVTSIGSYAFNGCSGLTSVTIPDSVTSIYSYAFYGCTSLTSIVIPDSVIGLGNDAFNGCNSLASIKVESGNTVYDSRNNCNGIINTSTNALIQGCKTTVIPNTVTSIGGCAFQACKGLTHIVIPDSVTNIDANAFLGCDNLTSVAIGSGVTSIGHSAFNQCSSLTSIDIPSSVTSIGDYAFNECSNLTSIVSNAITAPTIQSYTFNGVKTDGTLTVPSGSSGYDVWMDTSDYYLGKYGWTKVEK